MGQSLAGRTAVLHLLPLTLDEIRRFPSGPESLDGTMFTGSYPRIHDRNIPPSEWLGAYVATYVERDVRTVTNVGDLVAFQRFLGLCAGRVGQILNFSGLAADSGVSQPTAKAWLSILEAGFLTFRLPPWSGNVRKRLTKMPKLFFHDTGLVCWLLGLREPEQLRTHPLRGAIFENWVVSEVVKHRTNMGERGGLFFYRDAGGLEADLVVEAPGGATIIEVKAGRTVQPDMFPSLLRVRELVDPESRGRAILVHGGEDEQVRLGVHVVPWSRVGEDPGAGLAPPVPA